MDCFRALLVSTGVLLYIQIGDTHDNGGLTSTSFSSIEDNLRKIELYHKECARTLVIMRGAPGSGKTTTAKHIVNITVGAGVDNYKSHIFSNDDFFMHGQDYIYDASKMAEAHKWNNDRIASAINSGLSPVIVDCLNIRLWHMEPYLRDGVRNGYIIFLIEPKTSWSKDAEQLSRMNIHDVPKETIRRMLVDYEDTAIEGLIKHFNVSYPCDMVPPIKRMRPEC